ncbi:MAG TPA: MBG domain-containing protein, partial [Thermoanaerobaculia bacterium]
LAGGEPNDRFRLVVSDVDGDVLGSACSTTWELGYKTASFGFGGGTTPRAINGFDFWSYGTPNGTVVGYIDGLTMTASSPAPLQVSITGSATACSGGTTSLTATASGGSGSISSYTWRDASSTVVGNASTFEAAPGSYTVTVTDTECGSAVSSEFVVGTYPPLGATITGTTDVCFGQTTTLTANASGGSGTISGYTWRDASNTIVGTASTLVAGVGTYTVTITDAECGSQTSAPVTVQKTCNATPVVTWNDPADITYGTPLSATQLNATANVAGTFTYTPVAGTVLNAGANQVLSVDFAPSDSANYDPVNGTTVQINVLQATPVVTVSGGPFVYDGTQHSATVTARDANGNDVSGSFVITYDGDTTAPANAGTYAVVATFTSNDQNFKPATGNGTLTIGKATPVVTWKDPANIVYGTPLSATQLNATANVPGSFTYTPASGTVLNAGANQTLSVDFVPDDTNYKNVNGTTVSITVTPATPVVTVTGGTVPYDGSPHGASAVARDASNNVVSGTFAITYDGSTTVPVNAGTYAVLANFTSSDPNFANASGNGTLTITKATPVVTWSDPAAIFYGTPLTATQLNATANTAGTFSYTPPAGTVLNAGANQTLSVDFTPSDSTNYHPVNGTTVQIDVLQATPVVTVSGGPFVYDGTQHSASATARDANGDDVSGSIAITYDGSTTAPTNAGTYAVVATFTSSNPNFKNASGNGTLTIGKATPVVTVTAGTFVYDGTPHPATAVARDANGSEISGTFAITYDGSTTAPTNAGTYAVVATFTSSNPNFTNATGNGTLTITKATPVVSWSDPADIVYGTPLSASQLNATANVAGTFTYTPAAGTVLNAGANQTLSVHFAPADSQNYDLVNGTVVHIDVLQATPVVTVTGGPFVYDGAQHTATAVARDANGNEISGTFVITYDGSTTAPTNAGTYAVVATFTSSDPNFTNASGNGSLTITKATPIVSWSHPADIVYGTPLSATQLNATANVSGTFTYTPAAGTILNAGANQTLSVDFAPNDTTNYNAVNGTTVTIDVNPAVPVVTVTGGTFVYDGTPHAATAVARDANGNEISGTFVITYDGRTTAPTTAGTYAVLATFTSSNPNFVNASGTGSLAITKAPSTIAITGSMPDPPQAGQSTTIFFTVSPANGGGQVTISNGTSSCVTGRAGEGCALVFPSPGQITVTATYSGDANHDGSTASEVVTVVGSTSPASASLEGSTTICPNSSATLRVTLEGTAPWRITWSDGTMETASEPLYIRIVEPSRTTTYTLESVRDANGWGSVSGTATVTVTDITRPVITTSSAFVLGQRVTLTASSNGTSFQWFHNGAEIAGQSTSQLVIEALTEDDFGTYTVRASRDGCTSALSAAFTVELTSNPTSEYAVLPAVGNTPGDNGSYFRTTVHLTNATDEEAEGEITFIDPSLP